jgi:hypothetical protein
VYHHFDPPWAVKQHHEPAGMIALCAEHHAKADAGAFTIEQLRELKSHPARVVAGTFDWRRRELLAVVGGNLYFETPVIVQVHGAPLIWFERDDQRNLLLSVRMLSVSREPRLWLDNNDWHLEGPAVDLQSPPNGRLIRVQYPNGDSLRVEFLDLDSASVAATRYSHFQAAIWQEFAFPITAVELQMQVGGTPYYFGPTESRLGGMTMTGCVFKGNSVGLSLS